MNYVDLFTNGGQGMETKPAGTAMNIPLNGHDKAVEPAQATENQEPVPNISKAEKNARGSVWGGYNDSLIVSVWRWCFLAMRDLTSVPPGKMSNTEFKAWEKKYCEPMWHKKGTIGMALAVVLYCSGCEIHGKPNSFSTSLLWLLREISKRRYQQT